MMTKFRYNNSHSNRPPAFSTTRDKRVHHVSIAARTVSIGILSHSLSMDRFIASSERCCFALTFDSKIPHRQKSIGFRSGEEGGHSSDQMKLGKLALHQACVDFEECAGAESCWKIESPSGYNLETSGFTTDSKISR